MDSFPVGASEAGGSERRGDAHGVVPSGRGVVGGPVTGRPLIVGATAGPGEATAGVGLGGLTGVMLGGVEGVGLPGTRTADSG